MIPGISGGAGGISTSDETSQSLTNGHVTTGAKNFSAMFNPNAVNRGLDTNTLLIAGAALAGVYLIVKKVK